MDEGKGSYSLNFQVDRGQGFLAISRKHGDMGSTWLNSGLDGVAPEFGNYGLAEKSSVKFVQA